VRKKGATRRAVRRASHWRAKERSELASSAVSEASTGGISERIGDWHDGQTASKQNNPAIRQPAWQERYQGQPWHQALATQLPEWRHPEAAAMAMYVQTQLARAPHVGDAAM